MIENIFNDLTFSALRYDFHRCMYDFFQQKGYDFYWVKDLIYEKETQQIQEYYYFLKKEDVSLLDSDRIQILSSLDSFELFYEKNLYSMSCPHSIYDDKNEYNLQDLSEFCIHFYHKFVDYQLYLTQYCHYLTHFFCKDNASYIQNIIKQCFHSLEDTQHFLMNDLMNIYKHYLPGETLVQILKDKKATHEQIDQFILIYYFSLDFSQEKYLSKRLNYSLKNFLLKHFQGRETILLPYCSRLPSLEHYLSHKKPSIEPDFSFVSLVVECHHLQNTFMIDNYSSFDYFTALDNFFAFITHFYHCNYAKFERLSSEKGKEYILMRFVSPDDKLTLTYFKELIVDYFEKIYEEPTISYDKHLDNFFAYREYKHLNQELPLPYQELIEEKSKI